MKLLLIILHVIVLFLLLLIWLRKNSKSKEESKTNLLIEELNELEKSNLKTTCFLLYINGKDKDVASSMKNFMALPTVEHCIKLSDGLFIVYTETNGEVTMESWVSLLAEGTKLVVVAIRINCLTGMAWKLPSDKSLILDVGFKASQAYGRI